MVTLALVCAEFFCTLAVHAKSAFGADAVASCVCTPQNACNSPVIFYNVFLAGNCHVLTLCCVAHCRCCNCCAVCKVDVSVEFNAFVDCNVCNVALDCECAVIVECKCVLAFCEVNLVSFKIHVHAVSSFFVVVSPCTFYCVDSFAVFHSHVCSGNFHGWSRTVFDVETKATPVFFAFATSWEANKIVVDCSNHLVLVNCFGRFQVVCHVVAVPFCSKVNNVAQTNWQFGNVVGKDEFAVGCKSNFRSSALEVNFPVTTGNVLVVLHVEAPADAFDFRTCVACKVEVESQPSNACTVFNFCALEGPFWVNRVNARAWIWVYWCPNKVGDYKVDCIERYATCVGTCLQTEGWIACFCVGDVKCLFAFYKSKNVAVDCDFACCVGNKFTCEFVLCACCQSGVLVEQLVGVPVTTVCNTESDCSVVVFSSCNSAKFCPVCESARASNCNFGATFANCVNDTAVSNCVLCKNAGNVGAFVHTLTSCLNSNVVGAVFKHAVVDDVAVVHCKLVLNNAVLREDDGKTSSVFAVGVCNLDGLVCTNNKRCWCCKFFLASFCPLNVGKFQCTSFNNAAG